MIRARRSKSFGRPCFFEISLALNSQISLAYELDRGVEIHFNIKPKSERTKAMDDITSASVVVEASDSNMGPTINKIRISKAITRRV